MSETEAMEQQRARVIIGKPFVGKTTKFQNLKGFCIVSDLDFVNDMISSCMGF